ncbi:phenylacetate-CoA oxygenase subunit PaaJ [Roseomonas sp. GC11]|uniref:1,2-phenylacetyl-CoA epoxidase subunit PaaD n=1 Tax=Roseomonas sp. GC11 TaxID=2950546 RepID=UPI00210D84AD|nr:1,2-phenylacetyl-CoA epoxidase subunit PaaD [Roseomonas sp. GC11]MCQ4160016.1 phenylacetate-CoA oxygenase subunit PaaJ [Roseomonas sp. GC11]
MSGLAPAGDTLRAAALAAAATVPDPEIPSLSIADLGVLRDARLAEDGAVEVDITPTYSGCPAMAMIAFEVEAALLRAGLPRPRVRTVLAPAWTTDWMTGEAREKLRQAGIAPPPPGAGRAALLGLAPDPACPRCASADTERLSEFGTTACKSLWRCRACREPFDHFKCI